MENHPMRFLVLMMAGWMNRRQQGVIAYLQEENRVLQEKLGGKRLRFAERYWVGYWGRWCAGSNVSRL